MSIFSEFTAKIAGAAATLAGEGDLPAGLDLSPITVEPPRDPSHGDLASNAAMVLAKPARMNPREIATALAQKLARLPEIDAAEVAGPGFLNLRLNAKVWRDELAVILGLGDRYGRSTMGNGQRINVEYVSANPTGPMHMGHCRGAVVGDALASLLEYAGFAVTREYYINDAGAQVDVLARSVHLRYREALGETVVIPDGLYPGDYLVPVGHALAVKYGDRFRHAPESEWLELFRTEAVDRMMDRIRSDLHLLGIDHDTFSKESAVMRSGAADRAVAALRHEDLVYEGVLPPPKGQTSDDWEPVELTLFRSSRFGDDQDRPIKKSDGSWTYFGLDMAYHAAKAEAADALVDIWGADHGGTVKRIQAAVSALTGGKVPLDVKLIQMVHLLRAGEPVKMSKRAGNFVTLAEVVEEVGKDVVRFIMLTKRPDSQLDFDFAKVVEQSRDNPVFYVQYAHARIRSLARKLAEAGIDLPPPDTSLLNADELALIKLASAWPRIVEQAAVAREPHRVAFYLQDLAAAFHSLWNAGNDDPDRRFLLPDRPALTAARLALANGVAQVIRNGLGVMGVEAAEQLH